jgi:DNA topoisomerase VI subunit B
VYNNIKVKKKLLLKSLNFVYEPYEVSVGDIKEVWEFVNYISTQMPESNQSKEEVNKSVTLIQEEMRKIAEVLQRKPQTLLKRKPHAR